MKGDREKCKSPVCMQQPPAPSLLATALPAVLPATARQNASLHLLLWQNDTASPGTPCNSHLHNRDGRCRAPSRRRLLLLRSLAFRCCATSGSPQHRSGHACGLGDAGGWVGVGWGAGRAPRGKLGWRARSLCAVTGLDWKAGASTFFTPCCPPHSTAAVKFLQKEGTHPACNSSTDYIN